MLEHKNLLHKEYLFESYPSIAFQHQVESAEKRKKKEYWLHDDYHEELLRSRDEDDFCIYSESEINELGMGMEEIAKQMQEHDKKIMILTSWMMMS